jgi:1,5-anhydro-D-fructose reductase (1,5-anhydro-D-mannitol-forming)
MDVVRWGIIGCGAVTEVKSGPALQKAEHSALVAVMRRDRDKAGDYARRHGVARFYDCADRLIEDPEVDAIYIATPPAHHYEFALQVAEAGKPCLVEKPMAMNHAECVQMVAAFQERGAPLFVAYYRRALPRFLKVRELLLEKAAGTLSSVHIFQYGLLADAEAAKQWRYDPEIAGGGLFMDLASHGFDLLDFLLGPIKEAAGFSVNTGGAYAAEDVTAACFEFESGVAGTGVWNFNSNRDADGIVFTASNGELHCPVFSDTDIVLRRQGKEEVFRFRNPPHVHQPLVQTIVNEILGMGKCASTGVSGARTARVTDACLKTWRGSHLQNPVSRLEPAGTTPGRQE